MNSSAPPPTPWLSPPSSPWLSFCLSMNLPSSPRCPLGPSTPCIHPSSLDSQLPRCIHLTRVVLISFTTRCPQPLTSQTNASRHRSLLRISKQIRASGDPTCRPVAPFSPGGPVRPVLPFSPSVPLVPWEPRLPWGPGSPTAPTGPCSPFTPTGPGMPCLPVEPFSPTGPLSPWAQFRVRVWFSSQKPGQERWRALT